MSVDVVPYSAEWPEQFEAVAARLDEALRNVEVVGIEHVGSTAVPGLAAKPILDIDVVVAREQVSAALSALEAAGYVHRGDLGLTDREALAAPDDEPRRNVYVCVAGSLPLRNHLAVRRALRDDPSLRDRYASLKLELSARPGMDVRRYTAEKSALLQEVLALSDLSDEEKRAIYEVNTRP